MDELRDAIYDFLYTLPEGDLRDIYNEYIDGYNYIEYMDCLDDILSSYTPREIIDNYSWIDTSCIFIDFENNECFNYITGYIGLDTFVDYVIDNNESFGYSDLRDILDGDVETEIVEDIDDPARFEDEY